MHTKTITVKTDWLSKIDGMRVKDAIAYLQNLNSEYILTYDMEGDTHGCSVNSSLSYEVPKTDAEIFADLKKHYEWQIAEREKGKQYYINRGQLDRLPAVEKLIADLRAKLEEAREKYCKE